MALACNGWFSLDWLINEVSPGDAAAGGSLQHRPPISSPLVWNWTSGTTAPTTNDIVWSKVDTVVASGANTYDLAGGITDRFGATITFAKVTMIMLINLSVIATDVLRIGPHTSNGFSAPWFGTTGWTVTAGTGDVLRVTEAGGANTVSFRLALVGRTA
jgi:hypothetical protein